MLERRLGLLEAVSLNMSMMVGIGPFITIPALLTAMHGPQAMIGWVLGAAVALCDGMVWSELAGAFSGTGGTYHYYDAAYGSSRPGRLLKFLFVWQFLFSAPLEIATGAIGLAKYLSYFMPALAGPAWNWGRLHAREHAGAAFDVTWEQVAAISIMGLATMLAYRRIAVAGRMMIVLWAGMLVTVTWVIVTSFAHFDPARALDFPASAWQITRQNAAGLGTALGLAMYGYLGYYHVCYMGDEVANPAKTIPRSILISVIAVGALYLAMNAGILGVIPWRQVAESEHVASDLMLFVHGPWAAGLVTILIIWTALASIFAGLLGYSRVPYASARAGHFIEAFAATHPTGHFPHRSLLLISGLAAVACLADLATVIAALLASRILIQFVGQIATVFYLRRHRDAPALPYRMPWFPLPALIALFGWLFVLFTSERYVLLFGLGSLALGWIVFDAWDRVTRTLRSNTPPAS
jgi:amino acid transporter